MSKEGDKQSGAANVLVIDDDETHRLMVQNILENEGYRVLEAEDGDGGLRILRETKIDLVLLDLFMPRRDGYSICEEIRSDPKLKDTPVIMVTGSEGSGAVDRAFAAKANDFINKPVRWDLLPYRVRFVLRSVENANKLSEALVQARAADEAKAQFMAAMGHEFRTPLNAIIGFSELIARVPFSSINQSKYAEYGEHILASGNRLLGLINAILDMIMLQDKKLALRLDPQDITSLLERMREDCTNQCKSTGQTFAMQIQNDLPLLNLDSRRIRQLLNNLLSNSSKFTPAGGKVELTAFRSGNNGVQITITDTGIGMNEIEIKTALEPFKQVDGRLSRAQEGAGLGLSIAKALTELHGGSLVINSVPGQGTAVQIDLPPLAETQNNSRVNALRLG